MSDAPTHPSIHPELTPRQRYEAALGTLTARERAFVTHYLVCLNKTKAARLAGYSEKTAAQIGYQLLQKTSVSAAVEAGMDLQAMPTSEILARLSAQARGSMGDFLRVDEEEVTLTWSLIAAPITKDENGEIEVNTGDLVAKLATQEAVQPTDRILHTVTVKRAVARLDLLAAAEQLGLVKKYSLDDDGKVSIELYDAQKALELLGKHRGLFIDRKEITGKDGGAIAVETFTKALNTAYADDPENDQADGE